MFFGDGAVDEGAFHEAVNFASLKKLPILFVCENNFYAIHSHHLKRHPLDNVWKRAKCYGIASERIDDGDIFKIYSFAQSSVEKLRSKNHGPIFLECLTSRWKEHVGPCDDFDLGYREEKEVLSWKKNDQLRILSDLIGENEREQISREVEAEIVAAFEFAEKSQFPDRHELYEDLFC